MRSIILSVIYSGDTTGTGPAGPGQSTAQSPPPRAHVCVCTWSARRKSRFISGTTMKMIYKSHSNVRPRKRLSGLRRVHKSLCAESNACARTHTHIHTYQPANSHTHTHTNVRKHVRTNINCENVYKSASRGTWRVRYSMRVCACVCVADCACVFVCLCPYASVCLHAFECAHVANRIMYC